jgi:pre-mRNA-splicing factor 18
VKAQAAKAGAAAAAAAAGGAALSEEDATAAAFKAAAAAVAAQRAEAALDFPARVALHFKRLMEEWEAETTAKADASPAWAASLEGRNAISTCRLTREHIRPLFRLLKRREVPSDIERALWCIVKAMQGRNYREAGDLYVRVAIGNAPWPIGVTMVGIHERSAREKIQAQSTAHVMHDEQSRKYLQGVKRLITFAQRRYPSTPSLSLEFNSGVNGSDKQARASMCFWGIIPCDALVFASPGDLSFLVSLADARTPCTHNAPVFFLRRRCLRARRRAGAWPQRLGRCLLSRGCLSLTRPRRTGSKRTAGAPTTATRAPGRASCGCVCVALRGACVARMVWARGGGLFGR